MMPVRWFVAIALASAGFAAAADTSGPCDRQKKFVLVMHGGVVYRGHDLLDDRVAVIEDLLQKARPRLQRGATSLEIVHDVIKAMEDSGVFNAGKGSIKNKNGAIEMDASIMDGSTLQAGAVAAVSSKVKNPISAARLILEESDNVMLVGQGAERYLDEIARLDAANEDFGRLAHSEVSHPSGTVGAVALDRCGNLTAGTSTGGFGRKVPGRVGDSPIIGAGTYANNHVAVSCTGHGEYFIRWSVAHDIAALHQYKGLDIMQAAAEALENVAAEGGSGGVIAIDALGNIAMDYRSTIGMVRGSASDTQAANVEIYRSQE